MLSPSLRLMLTLAIVLGAPSANAEVQLAGAVGSITINDNVSVASGASLTLNGTTINGNVLVRTNATLVSNSAVIKMAISRPHEPAWSMCDKGPGQ